MIRLPTGKLRLPVIILMSVILIVGAYAIWMGVLFALAYLLDFAFKGGGTFSVAFNKIVSSCAVLLPGFIAYFFLRQFLKDKKHPFSELSRPRKARMVIAHCTVMLLICAGIAYGNFASCDEFFCDDGEPLTMIEKRAVFFRLVIVSAVGMAVAYKRAFQARRPFG